MAVEKVDFRLRPGDLARPEDGTFQTHYEARVDRPLEGIDLNAVFQDVGQGRLQPGDQVTFCAYEGSMVSQDRRLREVRVCRIVAKVPEDGKLRTKAVWLGDTFKVPSTQAVPVKEKIQKLEAKPAWGGGWRVADDKDHTIETFKTEAEATAYIENLLPKPKAEAEAKPAKAAKEPPKAA